MKKLLVVAVAAAIATPAMADLTIGGSSRYTIRTIDGDYSNDGRVQMTIAGSTTSESGVTVSGKAAYNFNMGAASATDGVSMSIGNAAAKLTLGEADAMKVFVGGADAFEANANDSVNGIENGASRGMNLNNVILDINALEGVALQLSTRLVDTDQDFQVGAKASLGGVGFGLTHEVDGASAGNDITTFNVNTTLGGVALNVSYGADDSDNKSTAFVAAMNGFSVTYQTNEDGTTDEDNLYGSYTISDVAGVSGASVEIGAGNSDDGTNSVDEMGVRLSYTF